VRFLNINVAPVDGHKLAGLAVVGDARVTLEALTVALEGHAADPSWTERAAAHSAAWDAEVTRLVTSGDRPLPSQAAVIGTVNEAVGPHSVVVNAAGSMPGDLHKLWRTQEPGGYHLEYGYSCMGYEIPAGIGVKLADPTREVVVLIGDGSWLMMPSELVTALQEGVKIIVVLVDNHGYASIGSLSRSLGSGGFGTQARYADDHREHAGATLAVDLAANAASLGAHVVRAGTVADLRDALVEARATDRATVITVETTRASACRATAGGTCRSRRSRRWLTCRPHARPTMTP
jgi:3D-(3,5/4)-trihydroxycyclohexane-1,2-dione acylhydrolase (decyclizing)